MSAKVIPQPIPEVGKQYWFFDDGKITHSRLYQATVLEVLDEDKVPENIKEKIKENRANCDWIYSPFTDKVIRCSIKDYDDNDIWFIRTKDDGWFSIDVNSFWQSGTLDVDGHLMDWLDSLYD